MDTSLLSSQAICIVPVTNATFTPVRIGFSCHPFSLRPTMVAGSMSVCNFGKCCNSARSITVRVESETSGASEANADISEDSGVSVAVESEEKPEIKQRIKLGDIMGILNINAIEASERQRKTPDIRVGDIVEIKLEVPENKKRL